MQPRAWPRRYAGAVRLARLSAPLLAVVALGGCAGENKDGPAKVRTKADFIAAADRICFERDRRSRQLVREPDNNVGRLSVGLATAYAIAISKIEALALPPGADRAGAEKYVKSVVAMRRPVQRMKASASDLQAASSVSEVKRASAQLAINVNTVQALGDVADLNARDYGLKRCGRQQSLPVT